MLSTPSKGQASAAAPFDPDRRPVGGGGRSAGTLVECIDAGEPARHDAQSYRCDGGSAGHAALAARPCPVRRDARQWPLVSGRAAARPGATLDHRPCPGYPIAFEPGRHSRRRASHWLRRQCSAPVRTVPGQALSQGRPDERARTSLPNGIAPMHAPTTGHSGRRLLMPHAPEWTQARPRRPVAVSCKAAPPLRGAMNTRSCKLYRPNRNCVVPSGISSRNCRPGWRRP